MEGNAMTSTLTKTEISRLRVLTPNLQQLKLAVGYWQAMHAEAGSQKETAWRDYNDAVDKELPRALINDMYGTRKLFDDICRDTWREWETAKQNLLAMSN
jgi:hypothetical protein